MLSAAAGAAGAGSSPARGVSTTLVPQASTPDAPEAKPYAGPDDPTLWKVQGLPRRGMNTDALASGPHQEDAAARAVTASETE